MRFEFSTVRIFNVFLSLESLYKGFLFLSLGIYKIESERERERMRMNPNTEERIRARERKINGVPDAAPLPLRSPSAAASRSLGRRRAEDLRTRPTAADLVEQRDPEAAIR